MSDVLKEFEETAFLGCHAVRDFLTGVSAGDPKLAFARARVGAVAMSSYARLRATRANERQLQLIERKLDDERGLPAVADVRALPTNI